MTQDVNFQVTTVSSLSSECPRISFNPPNHKNQNKEKLPHSPLLFFSIALKFTAEHGLNGAHVPLLLLFPLLILSLTFAGETRTRFTKSVRPSLAQEVQSPTLIKWSNNRSFYFFTSLAMSDDDDHQVSSWEGRKGFIII